jgi:hypothetical protein
MPEKNSRKASRPPADPPIPTIETGRLIRAPADLDLRGDASIALRDREGDLLLFEAIQQCWIRDRGDVEPVRKGGDCRWFSWEEASVFSKKLLSPAANFQADALGK